MRSDEDGTPQGGLAGGVLLEDGRDKRWLCAKSCNTCSSPEPAAFMLRRRMVEAEGSGLLRAAQLSGRRIRFAESLPPAGSVLRRSPPTEMR